MWRWCAVTYFGHNWEEEHNRQEANIHNLLQLNGIGSSQHVSREDVTGMCLQGSVTLISSVNLKPQQKCMHGKVIFFNTKSINPLLMSDAYGQHTRKKILA